MSHVNLLFVDAYDSFSASITSLLRDVSNAKVTTIKIDTDIESLYLCSTTQFLSYYDCIVLGPGPGHPANESDIGLFRTVWDFAERNLIPVFGICLGFQTLGLRYGLKIERLPLPCHGHAKKIFHASTDIFHNAGKVVATQYNSLGFRIQSKAWMAVTTISSTWNSDLSHGTSYGSLHWTPKTTSGPGGLELLAWNEDGQVMAIRHQSLPFRGVQFHPESCKSSRSCRKLLQNWLQLVQPQSKALVPRSIEDRKAECSENGESFEHLYRHLCELTSHVSKRVTYRSVQSKIPRHRIAIFCYNKSKSGECVMLESTRKGRYSIYGFPSKRSWRLDLKPSDCVIENSNHIRSFQGVSSSEVVAVVEKLLARRKILHGFDDSPFWGGLIGFLSYELGLQFLNIGKTSNANSSALPIMSLLWIDRSIIIDHETGQTYLQTLEHDDHWIDDMVEQLGNLEQSSREVHVQDLGEVLSQTRITLPERRQYVENMQACQAELLSGNSYELCLTTEAIVKSPIGKNNSFNLYNNVQRHNPVPYAAYLELGNTTILCSSPEKFLGWSREGVLDMIPMKGTVKKSSEMTFEKASAILSTPKESAENLMIADLIRHDLYTALDNDQAKVEVIRLCDVVEHETVYQLVSHIRAYSPRKPDMSPEEATDEVIKTGCRALRCALPPGSMTGAPKERSCEILQGLEQRSRGVYAGVIGYFDIGGAGSWNVCIRSAFSTKLENKDGMQIWHVGAGGAITVLSDDEAEWQEMNTKLDSILRGFRE